MHYEIVFSLQSWHSWKFHNKGKIFSHPFLCVINLNLGHWKLFWQPLNQTACNEGSWQWPFFKVLHTSCGICILQAPKWSCQLHHEASFHEKCAWGFRCCKESSVVTQKMRNYLTMTKRIWLILLYLKCTAWEVQKPQRLGCGLCVWNWICWHVLLPPQHYVAANPG